MKELDKLRVLLPHWIEHNNGHEAECSKWATIAREQGNDVVAGYIEDAVKTMKEVNSYLEKALKEAGGKADQPHPHHHHHD